MTALRIAVERVRRPEYTGENRCLPCTVLNSAVAVAVTVVIGRYWLPAGVAALLVCAGTIYLRGYLVPGTPELTKRYFPERVLRAFGKEPTPQPRGAGGDTHGSATASGTGSGRGREEVEALLTGAGVVEACPDEDDLCLTDAFREVWWRRIRQFRDDRERARGHLAAVLDVDPAALSFVDDDSYAVAFAGERVAEWPSDAACYADLAAEPTLAEWLPDWETLGDRRRTELLAGMRAFLESCPACEADLEQVEDVRRSCCLEAVDVSVDCADCGARVFRGSY